MGQWALEKRSMEGPLDYHHGQSPPQGFWPRVNFRFCPYTTFILKPGLKKLGGEALLFRFVSVQIRIAA
nr:hypothetical protein CFP56_23687 [Quercus suber]